MPALLPALLLSLLLLPALAVPASAATIAVTTTADDATVNGNCTLREAIAAAVSDVAVDACPAGSPSATDLVALGPGDHELALGQVAVGTSPGPLVLRGPSPPATAWISGSFVAASRLFEVGPGADLTIERLVLRFGDPSFSGGAVRAFQANLTARNASFFGNVAPDGGAIDYSADGAFALTLERCRFELNEARASAGQAEGGGVRLVLRGGAVGRIADTVFFDNLAATDPGGFGVAGGGLYAAVEEASSLEVVRSTFELNRVDPQPGSGGVGSGVRLMASSPGTRVTMVDSVLMRNDIVQPSVVEQTGALNGFAGSGAAIVLDRVRLEDNDPGEPGRHLVLATFEDGSVAATDLVLANGPATGLDLLCSEAPCTVGHATITGHATRAAALEADGAGELRVDNSILFQSHALTLSGPVVVDPSNFASGADPLFVDPLAGDFTLQPTSPAVGFGDSTLASVQPLDAAHAPRVVGTETDAGAYELGGLFGDGFESADTGAWTAAVGSAP